MNLGALRSTYRKIIPKNPTAMNPFFLPQIQSPEITVALVLEMTLGILKYNEIHA